jgi:hypothetical protein
MESGYLVGATIHAYRWVVGIKDQITAFIRNDPVLADPPRFTVEREKIDE